MIHRGAVKYARFVGGGVLSKRQDTSHRTKGIGGALRQAISIKDVNAANPGPARGAGRLGPGGVSPRLFPGGDHPRIPATTAEGRGRPLRECVIKNSVV